MAQEELVGDGPDSVQLWHANLVCVLSTLSFFAVGLVLEKAGKPKFVAANVEFWKWRNILISWIHGIVCGTWDFLCIVWYPDLLRDPVAYINNFMYLIVPFSAGYFIYDFIDMLLNKKLGTYWEVTLHHCIIVSSFMYNWNIKRFIGYNVIALMAEINSVFLHFRKLLQMCNVAYDSLLFRSASYVNLATFVTCRIVPIIRMLSGLYLDFHRCTLLYIVTFSFTITTGSVINMILFWRLLKSDVIRGMFGKGKHIRGQKENTVVVNGNNNAHLS